MDPGHFQVIARSWKLSELHLSFTASKSNKGCKKKQTPKNSCVSACLILHLLREWREFIGWNLSVTVAFSKVDTVERWHKKCSNYSFRGLKSFSRHKVNVRTGRTKEMCTRITWQFIDRRCWFGAESFIRSICTNPPSFQQSLQRFRLTGWMLASQPGAASPGVDAARLTEAQRASHAAAAARFTDFLRTVLG